MKRKIRNAFSEIVRSEIALRCIPIFLLISLRLNRNNTKEIRNTLTKTRFVRGMKIERKPAIAERAKNPIKKYLSGEKFREVVSPEMILVAFTIEKPIV
jgi:hypothetical protein